MEGGASAPAPGALAWLGSSQLPIKPERTHLRSPRAVCGKVQGRSTSMPLVPTRPDRAGRRHGGGSQQGVKPPLIRESSNIRWKGHVPYAPGDRARARRTRRVCAPSGPLPPTHTRQGEGGKRPSALPPESPPHWPLFIGSNTSTTKRHIPHPSLRSGASRGARDACEPLFIGSRNLRIVFIPFNIIPPRWSSREKPL